LAQVKSQLAIATADTERDTLLTQFIAGVSAAMARAAGRIWAGAPCLEKTSMVELITVPERHTEILWLAARPVVSVTEIKEAVFGTFDDMEALVEDEDYELDAATGALYRIGFWLTGRKAVRATYVGGYTAAGTTPGTGETALPADVVNAAVRQVIHEFNIRGTPGYQAESVQGSSVSRSGDDSLLPGVRQVMESYRRLG